MPRPHALLDHVTAISRPGAGRAAADQPSARHLSVTFETGRSGLLDPQERRAQVWAEVLESLQETRQPAYVEIDPESNLITELLLPIRCTVARVTPIKDGVEVSLVISQARHFLRRTNPDFALLRRSLEEARKSGAELFVTENDEHEIIDVRPVMGKSSSKQPKKGRS